MVKFESVAASFASYRAEVLPVDASDVQVVECRRAFYAGTWMCLMNLVAHIKDETDEDEAALALDVMKAECEAFAAAGGEVPIPPRADDTDAGKTHERLFALAKKFPDRSSYQLLLMKAAQALKRIDDAGDDFKISNVVSFSTGQARLDVVWGGYIAQIEIVKAREMAWMLLEAASIGEGEAGVMRFLMDRFQISHDQAVMVLGDFRHYREQNPSSSLVGQKVVG